MSVLTGLEPPDRAIADCLRESSRMDWIEQIPGQAWIKVLWTGREFGDWAVLFRWKAGYVAGAHKHLSSSHTFILSGKLQVRDSILKAGDYLYEPNGALHGATTAIEDTEYLFIGNGPLLTFNEAGITGYYGWEQAEATRIYAERASHAGSGQ